MTYGPTDSPWTATPLNLLQGTAFTVHCTWCRPSSLQAVDPGGIGHMEAMVKYPHHNHSTHKKRQSEGEHGRPRLETNVKFQGCENRKRAAILSWYAVYGRHFFPRILRENRLDPHYNELSVYCSPDSYVEILILHVMIRRGGAFENRVGHEGGAPQL